MPEKEGAISERESVPAPDDIRFVKPLYTVAEAARFVRVPESTLRTWAHGYRRERAFDRRTESGPVITTIPRKGRAAEIPFVGLVEAHVAAAFRESGVSMQHIRQSRTILQRELGFEHVLASRALHTDGATVLYNYSQTHELDQVAVVVTGQRVFAEVILHYLSLIQYDRADWASLLFLPITVKPLLVVDPRRAFGQPVFVHGGARMEDVIGRFRAGESIRSLAGDFDLRPREVEDVIRASLPAAA